MTLKINCKTFAQSLSPLLCSFKFYLPQYTLILFALLLNIYTPHHLFPKTSHDTFKLQASFTHGNIQSKRPISRFRKVYAGETFFARETFLTSHNSYLQLTTSHNASFQIFPNSSVFVSSIQKYSLNLILLKGQILVLQTPPLFQVSVKIQKLNILVKSQKISSQFLVQLQPSKNKPPKITISSSKGLAKILTPHQQFFLYPSQSIILSPPYLTYLIPKNYPLKYPPFPKNPNPLPFDPQHPIQKYTPELQSYSLPKKISKPSKQQFYPQFSLAFHSFHSFHSKLYYSIAFFPKFQFSHFTLQFRFLIYPPLSNPFQFKSAFNSHEWSFLDLSDTLRDIVSKIDFFSYANPQKNTRFSLAPIQNASFAYGLIQHRYQNTLFSPKYHILGFQASVDFDLFAFQTFISDVTKVSVFGFRLQNTQSSDLDFGLNLIFDFNPLQDQQKTWLLFASFDFAFPILNQPKLSLISEIAVSTLSFDQLNTAKLFAFPSKKFQLPGKNLALLIGSKGSFPFLQYQFSIQYLISGFDSRYFDFLYEVHRPFKFFDLASNQNQPNSFAFSFHITPIFSPYLALNLEYFRDFSPPQNPIPQFPILKLNHSLGFFFSSLPPLLNPFQFQIQYQIKFPKLANLFSNPLKSQNQSLIHSQISYSITPHSKIILHHKKFFLSPYSYPKSPKTIPSHNQYSLQLFLSF